MDPSIIAFRFGGYPPDLNGPLALHRGAIDLECKDPFSVSGPAVGQDGGFPSRANWKGQVAYKSSDSNNRVGVARQLEVGEALNETGEPPTHSNRGRAEGRLSAEK